MHLALLHHGKVRTPLLRAPFGLRLLPAVFLLAPRIGIRRPVEAASAPASPLGHHSCFSPDVAQLHEAAALSARYCCRENPLVALRCLEAHVFCDRALDHVRES